MRLEGLAEQWQVSVSEIHPTPTSLIAFGTRDGQPVVLKVVSDLGEEWNSGEVAVAFSGHGGVPVIEHAPGGILTEKLVPGTPLVDVVRAGDDEEATAVIARLIGDLHAKPRMARSIASAEGWGRAFGRYVASNDRQIPMAIAMDAAARYVELCNTQRTVQLVHGDLQHYNVLYDSRHGWTAIDPKGVLAEIEYELGAALRNPVEMPELYTRVDTVQRRVEQFSAELQVNAERVIGWAYAQVVLSAIWTIEDGGSVQPDSPALKLAEALRALAAQL